MCVNVHGCPVCKQIDKSADLLSLVEVWLFAIRVECPVAERVPGCRKSSSLRVLRSPGDLQLTASPRDVAHKTRQAQIGPVLEDWVGQSLVLQRCHGIREYNRGGFLKR
eukprot:SAG11_NODE_3602_length_2345_cov_3.522262_2_plen_109_part_00